MSIGTMIVLALLILALFFLGKSLELLSTADICLFVGNWETARGCRIEHDCCLEYGIPRVYFKC